MICWPHYQHVCNNNYNYMYLLAYICQFMIQYEAIISHIYTYIYRCRTWRGEEGVQWATGESIGTHLGILIMLINGGKLETRPDQNPTVWSDIWSWLARQKLHPLHLALGGLHVCHLDSMVNFTCASYYQHTYI